MPRTKICGDTYLYKDIATALERFRRYCGYTADEFSAVMRFSGTTWRRRLAKPEELTIGELWRAINALKIPYDDAAALLTAGIKQKPTKKAARSLDADAFFDELERRFTPRNPESLENNRGGRK